MSIKYFVYTCTNILIILCRMLLAFIMVPLVQKELDVFRETVWNTHRIRAQKDIVLPDRIPDQYHIYNFPEQYDLEDCGKCYTPCLYK